MTSVSRIKILSILLMVAITCSSSLENFGQTKKPAARTSKKSATTAKKTSRQTTGKSSTKKTPKTKNSPKKVVSAKEKNKLAAEKRRAALEEKRRRQKAAREAEARRRAFEKALKDQTASNILNDDPTGEDLEVRRAAAEALKGHAGTVVVMEPKTGKILSIVNQDWAVRRGFKPCSTIKLVTAIAGINERQIAPDGSIIEKPFPMNLDDALAYSNNTYFQAVGAGLGNQKMVSYARAMGLGQPTGINIPGETAGRVPATNNHPRIYSHGDDFEVTPLQLAVMVSAISNGGKRVVPRVFKNDDVTGWARPQSVGGINFPTSSFRGVIPGMIGAAQYGTARRGMDPRFEVAGKTGSCIGDGSWVGLFASVAPIEDPLFSVVVITRGGSERGRSAAAIASKIYNALRGRIPAKTPEQLWAAFPEFKPKNRVAPSTAGRLDSSADDDSDDGITPIKRPSVRTTVQASPIIAPTGSPSGTGPATRPRIVGIQ
jgi:beta-lactamase class D